MPGIMPVAGGGASLAVGETVTLLHPPLRLVGVSTWMWRGRQQNDSLVDGYASPCGWPPGSGGLSKVIVARGS